MIYVYVYDYDYVCVCISIYHSLSIYISLSLYIYIYIYITMCIHIYIYIYIYSFPVQAWASVPNTPAVAGASPSGTQPGSGVDSARGQVCQSCARKGRGRQGAGSFVRSSYASALCPVVVCPYLCTSDSARLGSGLWARLSSGLVEAGLRTGLRHD